MSLFIDRGVNRRELLGACAALPFVATASPANAAFPPEGFKDPGGLAQEYINKGVGYVVEKALEYDFRVDLGNAVNNFVSYLLEDVLIQGDLKDTIETIFEDKRKGVWDLFEFPSTGSSVIDGLLTALATRNPALGIAKTVVTIDMRMMQIDKELKEANQKLDQLYSEIAKLRERIRQDSIAQRLREYRARLAARSGQYRDLRGNMNRKLREASDARQEFETAHQDYLDAEQRVETLRGRNNRDARRAAQAASKDALTRREDAAGALELALENASQYAQNFYLKDIERLDFELESEIREIITYTSGSSSYAPTPSLVAEMATAITCHQAMHAELGGSEADIAGMKALCRQWAKEARENVSEISFGSALAHYAKMENEHMKEARRYCPGNHIGVSAGQHEIAYLRINQDLRGNNDPFSMGVFWWADVKQLNGRTRVKLERTEVNDFNRYSTLGRNPIVLKRAWASRSS